MSDCRVAQSWPRLYGRASWKSPLAIRYWPCCWTSTRERRPLSLSPLLGKRSACWSMTELRSELPRSSVFRRSGASHWQTATRPDRSHARQAGDLTAANRERDRGRLPDSSNFGCLPAKPGISRPMTPANLAAVPFHDQPPNFAASLSNERFVQRITSRSLDRVPQSLQHGSHGAAHARANRGGPRC